jgi:hypothetical protein
MANNQVIVLNSFWFLVSTREIYISVHALQHNNGSMTDLAVMSSPLKYLNWGTLNHLSFSIFVEALQIQVANIWVLYNLQELRIKPHLKSFSHVYCSFEDKVSVQPS